MKTLPKGLLDRVLWCAVTALLVVLWSGCSSQPAPSAAIKPAEQQLVAIGWVRWDLLPEQTEIHEVLAKHGIEASFDGSKVYDIWVDKNQANRALNILKTNRLIIEKKVFLRTNELGQAK